MNSVCPPHPRLTSAGLSILLVLLLVGCGSGAPGPNTQPSTPAEEPPTSSTSPSEASSEVAIRVNDRTVSMEAFNRRVKQRLSRMSQRMKKLPPKQRQQYMKKFRGRIERQLADRMATRLVIESNMEKANVRVSDTEVEQRLDQVAGKQFADRQSLEEALKKQGRSLDEIREQIRTQMKIQRYVEANVPEETVSREEAREYFEKNRGEYDEPEKVRARHILVKNDTDARSKLDRISQRLKDGEDFETVAKEESEGPSARRGGDLGFFSRDRMADSFSRVAFRTPVGEISDPVMTRFGYHIIKVEDKRPAVEASYENVEDTVVRTVRQQRRRKKIQQFIQKLKDEADITMNVGKRPPAGPRGAPQPMKPGSGS